MSLTNKQEIVLSKLCEAYEARGFAQGVLELFGRLSLMIKDIERETEKQLKEDNKKLQKLWVDFNGTD